MKRSAIEYMIPITKPYFGREEASSVRKVLLSGWVTQGPRVAEFENDFASYVGSKYACAVSSCTTALHLALLAVGVKPGDVVITVSHSFIATANSVRYCGAEPVFVDIDTDTFNMSVESLEKCLNEDCEVSGKGVYYRRWKRLARGESPLRYYSGRPKTGRIVAIMPVHQMGMPCDIKSILAIARKFNIPVVEDAACAIGSEISMNEGRAWEKIGRPHGDIACFSFHPRKILTTGDGGMLNTNNPDYDNRFRLLRQHGMVVSDRMRHLAKKISFEEYLATGYNYRMTDIQAAVGIVQLKHLGGIIKDRRRIASIYNKKLKSVSWLKLPEEPSYARTNWQSYPIKVLDNAPMTRNRLMQRLADRGVSTRRGIMNAHQEAPYKNSRPSLRNSEEARDSVILLPLFYGIKDSDIEKIAGLFKDA